MRKFIVVIVFAFAAGLLFSCKPSKQELLSKIENLAHKLHEKEADYDVETAAELEMTYVDFIENYKEDSLYAKILFEAGEHATTNQSSRMAVDFLTEFVETYPEDANVPDAFIDLAIVYETQMFDLEKAEYYLQQFLNKYPDHELVEVAKSQLDNLGRTPEEIMEEILKKQQADSLDSTAV